MPDALLESASLCKHEDHKIVIRMLRKCASISMR